MPGTVIVTKGRIPVQTLLVSSLAVSSSSAALDCGQLVRKSSPSLPRRHPILKKLQKLFIASARFELLKLCYKERGYHLKP